MEQIRISGKNLGAMALKDFCPRCFYIKLKLSNKLPWQIFPGIFSSIDAYTKRCIHALIDQGIQDKSYLAKFGSIKKYHKPPNWRKFQLLYSNLNIILSGEADNIFELVDGSSIINDNKTAKHSKNQDELLPMYEVQLNAYKAIAEGTKQFYPVTGLYLTYFEPHTDEEHARAFSFSKGFTMDFEPKIVPIVQDHKMIGEYLEEVRRLYDMPHPPDGRDGCKDCQAMDNIFGLLNHEMRTGAKEAD